LKFSGVTILQGVEFPIFLLIFAWALQQCSATALPVITTAHLTFQRVRCIAVIVCYCVALNAHFAVQVAKMPGAGPRRLPRGDYVAHPLCRPKLKRPDLY